MTWPTLPAVPLALSFDDVLLVPAYSEILPHTTHTVTTLGGKLTLPVPFLSAAMDTVTEAPMAIAVAQAGGLGVVHKNLTVSAQADAVRAVKAAAACANACVDDAGKLCVAAAIGVGSSGQARAQALVAAGADMLVVDTAHGHSRGVLEMVRWLRAQLPHTLIAAGNVATPEATQALAEAGAQVIKVGIGPGSICTTRAVSGVGVPQWSAVRACAAVGRRLGVSVIADGGVRQSGDCVKALAAGAHAVMLGSVLAGADEAPGEVFEHAGVRMRRYRGMGSVGAMRQGSADRYFQGPDVGSSKKLVPEGIEAAVPTSGPVADTLTAFAGGVRAGMGYLGAAALDDLYARAHFVQQTSLGLAESRVHDVQPITV